MEEENERNWNSERPRKYEIFTKSVKAGRRTYFFDVRTTQENDLYLTITESKKSVSPDGHITYERHKIFLYPEDFDLYSEGLAQIINYIRNTNSRDVKVIKRDHSERVQKIENQKDLSELEVQESVVTDYSNMDVEFDELGNKHS